MAKWTLDEIATALRQSWSADTCDPADLSSWSELNPARGQCGTSALVLNDLLGGDLVLADVLWPDGAKQGHHYWNVPDGQVVDLTLEQFTDGEVVQPGQVVQRPPGPPGRCGREYDVLRARVLARLTAANREG